MFLKILVPLDGSQEAEKALDYLQHVASKQASPADEPATGSGLGPLRDEASSVRLLRVVPLPILVEGNMMSQQILDSELEISQEYLDRIADRLRSEGYQVGHAVTRLADASEAILAEAERASYDLILMTSHCRTGVERFLTSSVAERVCRHACCPVLTVGRKSFSTDSGADAHQSALDGHHIPA